MSSSSSFGEILCAVAFRSLGILWSLSVSHGHRDMCLEEAGYSGEMEPASSGMQP